MEQVSSTQLDVACREQALEVEALESAFELHRLRIFRFILVSLRDRDAAETLTQDCFFKAYRAGGSFRNECSLETWLMHIAVNLVRDHVRNRRLQFWRRTSAVAESTSDIAAWMPDGQCSPETGALLKQQVVAVFSAAALLPERQRTVFLLRFVEDMELLEIAAVTIAAVTGMKEGTVKTHLFRALRTIRLRVEAYQ